MRGEGRTCLEYDKPSSLFGQFNDDRITPVANMLGRKLGKLVAAAVTRGSSTLRLNEADPIGPAFGLSSRKKQEKDLT